MKTETWNIKNKTCLVTGSTDGMGLETARALAKSEAHVIIVGRSLEKGTKVVEQIKSEAGHENIDLLLCDLSSQADIRRLADEVNERYPSLHVLINNAGGFFDPRSETDEGIEYTWALNHLAYFLLTNLLIEKIKASAPARIISVSSVGHKTEIDFDDIEFKTRDYSSGNAYTQSKLANIMFTFDLARQLEGTGVTANVLHPGWVKSAFGQTAKGFKNWLMFFIMRHTFMISQEKGAETAIHLATEPSVSNETGKYWAKCTPTVPLTPLANDQQLQKKLWDVCADMTSL